jgi:hypothetical protein
VATIIAMIACMATIVATQPDQPALFHASQVRNAPALPPI